MARASSPSSSNQLHAVRKAGPHHICTGDGINTAPERFTSCTMKGPPRMDALMAVAGGVPGVDARAILMKHLPPALVLLRAAVAAAVADRKCIVRRVACAGRTRHQHAATTVQGAHIAWHSNPPGSVLGGLQDTRSVKQQPPHGQLQHSQTRTGSATVLPPVSLSATPDMRPNSYLHSNPGGSMARPSGGWAAGTARARRRCSGAGGAARRGSPHRAPSGRSLDAQTSRPAPRPPAHQEAIASTQRMEFCYGREHNFLEVSIVGLLSHS